VEENLKHNCGVRACQLKDNSQVSHVRLVPLLSETRIPSATEESVPVNMCNSNFIAA